MSKPKILLVDDMGSMRAVIKAFLVEGGYLNIVEAADGIKALDLLKHGKFDFIVCDWDMPNMTGLELLIEVRASEQLKHLPFLMLTATNNVDKVKAAIDAGVSDYIAKPFKPKTLTDKIKGLT